MDTKIHYKLLYSGSRKYHFYQRSTFPHWIDDSEKIPKKLPSVYTSLFGAGIDREKNEQRGMKGTRTPRNRRMAKWQKGREEGLRNLAVDATFPRRWKSRPR